MARRAYLCLYNMVQFTGWSYGFYLFTKYLLKKGTYIGVWPEIALTLTIFQTLQSVEVIHCILKLVPSNAVQTAMQIASRLILVWGILRPVPETRDSLGLPLLMTAWSIAEATRYLYYALNVYNVVPKILVWCRYSFFIILYPIGVTGELWAIISALPIIWRTNMLSLPLPNPLNVSVYYSWILYSIMASYIPFFPQLYGYMLRQRKKFLSPDTSSSGKKVH